MDLLAMAFLSGAALVWMSTFGYLLLLWAIACSRQRICTNATGYPRIAVVVPMLNEERLILSKLADVRRADYPPDLMTVVVVDGGSTDGSVRLVQDEIDRGMAVQLLQMSGARAKSDQIRHAMEQLPHEILVSTDVDTRVEPSCIARLVDVLLADSHTAVVGAVVHPDTDLAEERMHWRLLNHLWWLEGEALSAAMVPGVCYAFKSAVVQPVATDARADDIHMAQIALARGAGVRICRAAYATELRVPQSWSEFMRFRRRRGGDYRMELQRLAIPASAPGGARIAGAIRLWHFSVTPKLVALLGILALVLVWTPLRDWVGVAAAGFAVPAIVVSAWLAGGDRRGRWWQRGIAVPRLLIALWWSLLAIDRDQRHRSRRPQLDPLDPDSTAGWPEVTGPEASLQPAPMTPESAGPVPGQSYRARRHAAH